MRRATLIELALAAVCASAFTARESRAALFSDVAFRFLAGDPDARNPIAPTEGPKNVTSGDLNGDGLSDIAACNLDGSVSVFLSLGERAFSDQILCPAAGLLEGASLRDIVLGDFDTDGALDAAVADIARRTVVILHGLGDGRLQPVLRVELAQPVRSLAAGELTGDELLDLVAVASPPDCERGSLVAACGGCASVWLIPGESTGSFGTPVEVESGFAGCLYDVALRTLPSGEDAEILVVDYASKAVRIYRRRGDRFRRLAPLSIPGRGPRALRVAFVDERCEGGQVPEGAVADVVVADRDSGMVFVYLGLPDGSFQSPIAVPTGASPRDLAVGDLNGDGFCDIVCTSRFDDKIVVMEGFGGGWFRPAMMLPTGVSPRNIVLADFTGDGVLDAAVNNRISSDVSVFFGKEGLCGFLRSRHQYATGFTPMDLTVGDFNGDRYPDAAVAALRSSDIRIRLNCGDGTLGPEVSVPMDMEPVALQAADVNRDTRQDIVVVGTKRAGSTTMGSLVVLLSETDGTFEVRPSPAAGLESFRPQWLRVGDLSGDGILDAVVGSRRGHVVLLKGTAEGTFQKGGRLPTTGSGVPAAVALADFTSDGLLDIATTERRVYVNDGSFFSEEYTGTIHGFFPSSFATAGRRARTVVPWYVEAGDLDSDGKPDLMLALSFANPDPLGICFGNGDGTFSDHAVYGAPDRGVVAMAASDFDGDGITDIVIGDRCSARVLILRGTGGRKFEFSESRSAYRVTAVSVCDLNQDGRLDVLGIGAESLWAMVNGGHGELIDPVNDQAPPPMKEPGVCINEILPSNRGVDRLGVDERTPDWLELYNSAGTVQDLTQWRLTVQDLEGETSLYVFPEGTVLHSHQYLAVLFGRPPSGSLPAPALFCFSFKLPREGATVTLADSDGVVVDRVTYGPMPVNVSLARAVDGAISVVFNPVPTLCQPNSLPVNLKPTIEPGNVVLAEGRGIFVTAQVFDDIAPAYVGVAWRRAGTTQFTEVAMGDTGHGDRAPGDNIFGALIGETEPGTIEYYLRVVDVEGSVDISPGGAGPVFKISLPEGEDAFCSLRISEVLSARENLDFSQFGLTADWVELVNCGSETVPLGGLILTDELYDSDNYYVFPGDAALGAGEYVVVQCSGGHPPGNFEAPFRLSRFGGELVLFRPGEDGAPVIIDSLAFPALDPDTAYGRLSCSSQPQVLPSPTPGWDNSESAGPFVRGDANGDGHCDLSDAVGILRYLFVRGVAPSCLKALDANDSGAVNIADAVYLLGYLFASRFQIAPPFPGCGVDLTVDRLPCETPPYCRP